MATATTETASTARTMTGVGTAPRRYGMADSRSLLAPASTLYAVSNARSMATEMRFQLRASASN